MAARKGRRTVGVGEARDAVAARRIAEGRIGRALRVVGADDAHSAGIAERVVDRAHRAIRARGEAVTCPHARLICRAIVGASALHAHVEREIAAWKRTSGAMSVAQARHTEMRDRIAVKRRDLAVVVDQTRTRIAAFAPMPSGTRLQDGRGVERSVAERRIGRLRVAFDRRRQAVEDDGSIARREQESRHAEKRATGLHGVCRLIDSASARANPLG
jgi:hypothetical protein